MALSIASSYFWRGNEGYWSTFNVLVGTGPDAQQFEVLPATSFSATLLILSGNPSGCPSGDVPEDCPELRGGLIDLAAAQANGWNTQTSSEGEPYFSAPFFAEDTNGLPTYENVTGEVGYDYLALNWAGGSAPPGPLKDQVIMATSDLSPWVGLLGISATPSHVHGGGTSEASILSTMASSGSIPGLNWAYTAGAYHRAETVGSLTLGGYDRNRFEEDSILTVAFSRPDITRDLGVTVKEITISVDGSLKPVAASLPTLTLIDSTVPEIWLPQATCDQFEAILGLTWDQGAQMYLVNDTLRESLQARALEITFFLSSNETASSEFNVTFPYAAFDALVQAPLAGITDDSTLNYFPLKPSPEEQGFLGRTFLQEVYVMADYDRSEFKVGQAKFPGHPVAQDLVTVHSPGNEGLGEGAIAGIAVGAFAAVAILTAGLLYWFCWRPRKQRKERDRREPETIRSGSLDDITIVGDATEMAEMDAPVEYFTKPLAPDDNFSNKSELDASATAQAASGRQSNRAELSAGSVHRPGHRHQSSWASGSSGISPMGEDRIQSVLGQPSPPMYPGGSPSPPPGDRWHHSSSSPRGLFEMAE